MPLHEPTASGCLLDIPCCRHADCRRFHLASWSGRLYELVGTTPDYISAQTILERVRGFLAVPGRSLVKVLVRKRGEGYAVLFRFRPDEKWLTPEEAKNLPSQVFGPKEELTQIFGFFCCAHRQDVHKVTDWAECVRRDAAIGDKTLVDDLVEDISSAEVHVLSHNNALRWVDEWHRDTRVGAACNA